LKRGEPGTLIRVIIRRHWNGDDEVGEHTEAGQDEESKKESFRPITRLDLPPMTALGHRYTTTSKVEYRDKKYITLRRPAKTRILQLRSR
jgi:hypothetical protein